MCISFSKKNIRFILILLSLTIILQPFTVIANAEGTVEKIYCNATLEDDFAPNKVLVVTQNNGEFQAANNYFSDIEYTSITDISLSSSQSLTNDSQINEKRIFCLEFDFNSKARVLDVIDTLIEQDNVIYAGPDYYVEYDSITPNDVLLSQQWAIDNMQLPLAWDITTGSSNVVVGVIDTGIDGTHPDLVDSIDTSLCRDFTSGSEVVVGTPTDPNGHGTHVAGIIGAKGNNSIGITGTCWNIKIASLRVLDERGDGSSDSLIQAIKFAAENNIKILNMSLGSYYDDYALKSQLANYNGIVIAASGNDWINNDSIAVYPASYEFNYIISVGALTDSNTKASFSNYGATTVDLFAPGVDIKSTVPVSQGLYEYDSGTSMAAPYVTGVAALLLSKYPTMTATELKASILLNVDTVDGLSDYCVTGGKLNAYKALSNPHYHQYNVYTNLDTDFHSKACACGCVDTIQEAHSFSTDSSHIRTCVCGYRKTLGSHSYTYSYTWKSVTQHYAYCACGAGTLQGHVVESGSFVNGVAICISCGGRASAGITPFPPSAMQATYYTLNGSYVLPNGVIVLVDADIAAYMQGTLQFLCRGEVAA